MKKQRTDDKPYKSNCSDLYIDAANYITELICIKNSEKNNWGQLPEKFWNHPKYKNLYIREISQARNLLKEYDERAIIAAIKSYDARYILSLRNKNLIPIIRKQKIVDTVFEESENKNVVDNLVFRKKNPLKDL